MTLDNASFGELFEIVARGVPLTLALSVAAWLLAALLALLFAGGARSRFRAVRVVTDVLTMALRGVPELVALFFVYFGLNQYVQLNSFNAAVIALGVTAAPFAGEVYRAALATVPTAQRSAAASLGLSHWRTMTDVVAPQATRFAIPPMFNMLVWMTKVSSLASAIGVNEVVNRGQTVITGGITTSSVFFGVALAICLVYLIIVLPLDRLAALLERRLSYTRTTPRWRLRSAIGLARSV